MTNMQDFALADRQLFLRGTPTGATLAQKRIQAIEWLGTLYVFHPKNRLHRLAEPLPDFPKLTISRVLARRKK